MSSQYTSKVLSRILKPLTFLLGISCFIWAISDPRFRNAEGFLDGRFCLPFSVSVALVVLGWGIAERFRKSSFWFALALVGQAVALQMIEAGPYIRYQHYKPLYRLLSDAHPILTVYLIVQTGLVFIGFKTSWSKIKVWLNNNFKVWQLLGIGLVFFLSSATVSKDIVRYISELFFATFIQIVNLGNIVLMVWALPEEILVFWGQKLDNFFGQSGKEKKEKSPNIDRFVLLAAVWVIFLASILCIFSYQRHPHIPDEVMYLYQARYMANGKLTVPAPPVPEAFSFYMIPYESHTWYSIFPPGWPALLAIGFLLGVPWLVNPMLAGLNVVLSYVLFQEIFDQFFARVAVLLLCLSPWFIFMAMNFMSHTFALSCALFASVAIKQARKTGKTRWGWLGGFAVGILSLIRPLDGLIAAVVLGLWTLGVGERRLKISSILAFVMGIILTGAIIFPYNKHITGDTTNFPLTAYYEKYFGHKSNALGFGPERGLGWAIDPFPGHSPVDALVNANLNVFSINIELFGWSTGSIILIVFLLFSGNIRKKDFLMFTIIIAITATYSLYWFSGGPDFGARYWYLTIIPLIGLTVRSIQKLQEKFELESAGSIVNSTRIIVAVFALSFLTLINFFPWRALDKYHNYRGMRPGIRQLNAKYNFGKSLVLIRGNSSDYQSAWAYNPLDPHADSPIYAWDRNSEVRNSLLKAYPERPMWVVDGPSKTHMGFKVLSGPQSGQEMKKKIHIRNPSDTKTVQAN